jgi:hypothetical protein
VLDVLDILDVLAAVDAPDSWRQAPPQLMCGDQQLSQPGF